MSESTRTDVADLLALAGRFMASLLLMLLAMVHFLGGRYPLALFLAVAGGVLQVATLKLWRRLRRERAAGSGS